MKENRFCAVAFGVWLCLLCLPMGVGAAEVEPVVVEARSISLEWLALGFSSVWALILQLLRLRK